MGFGAVGQWPIMASSQKANNTIFERQPPCESAASMPTGWVSSRAIRFLMSRVRWPFCPPAALAVGRAVPAAAREFAQPGGQPRQDHWGIVIRHPERRKDHEAELVVVIGKTGSNIDRQDAWQHIAGYSSGLDMTTRGPEERSLRKSVDSYSVLGPCLVTADEMPDASNLDFSLTVNNEPRQKANTRDLIIGIAELIEFASSFYTLYPGDLIYTGTPAGVGPVLPGDRITTDFQGIGRMEVAVRAAPAAQGRAP